MCFLLRFRTAFFGTDKRRLVSASKREYSSESGRWPVLAAPLRVDVSVSESRFGVAMRLLFLKRVEAQAVTLPRLRYRTCYLGFRSERGAQ